MDKLNFVLVDVERTVTKAARAKFNAALEAAYATGRSTVVDATVREAKQCGEMAALTAKGALITGAAALVTAACAITTVTQPIVGAGESLWDGIKAGWKA